MKRELMHLEDRYRGNHTRDWKRGWEGNREVERHGAQCEKDQFISNASFRRTAQNNQEEATFEEVLFQN